MRALRDLVEAAARCSTSGWEMKNPSTHEFSLDNGEAQLRNAFKSVTCVRPERVGLVRLQDADVAADYVASVADQYRDEVTRPWSDVVQSVRNAVKKIIDVEGAFTVCSDAGAFVCR